MALFLDREEWSEQQRETSREHGWGCLSHRQKNGKESLPGISLDKVCLGSGEAEEGNKWVSVTMSIEGDRQKEEKKSVTRDMLQRL